MSYFYKSIDKDSVRSFIFEDLKVFGVKVPKLDKLAKAAEGGRVSRSASLVQLQGQKKRDNDVVFGVPLSFMDSIEDPNIGHIPKFLANARQYLLQNLSKEGLFRKNGSTSRQKQLVQYIEENEGVLSEGAHVFDVTSVIKQFFRSLPEPLIPHILQDAFVQAVRLSTADSKVYVLNLLCLLLPEEHLSVFRYLLEILSDVSSNSEENKMNGHNIALCLTPTLFHSKDDCKHIHQQAEAIELCINNVINIGVVPPSIEEKMVMLKSLEDQDLSNSAALNQNSVPSSGSTSSRRKRRSGSLQGLSQLGLVGSIRRSVERLKHRTSRLSSSVPNDLNSINQSEGNPKLATVDGTDNCTTPHIIQRSQCNEGGGFSTHKRRAIMDRSGLLGNSMMKINMSAPGPEQTFEGASQLSEMTMDSTKAEASKVSKGSRRKSWGSLKSPFSKRRRSVSAGPVFSPNVSRSSSRTRKLIRRLSGGKRKTPDMIGQRLAFDNEDDVAADRQRMPSAPSACKFTLGESMDIDGDTSNVTDCGTADDSQDHAVVQHVSRSRSKRRGPCTRSQARSADTRVIKRGRPNHLHTGLNRVQVSLTEGSQTQDSTSSLQSDDDLYPDLRPVVGDLLDTGNALASAAAKLSNVPGAKAASSNQSEDGNGDWVDCGAAEPLYKSVKVDPKSLARTDSFNTRMEKVARAHSIMFKEGDKPSPRRRQVQRAATYSVPKRANGKPPRPEKRSGGMKSQGSDTQVSVRQRGSTSSIQQTPAYDAPSFYESVRDSRTSLSQKITESSTDTAAEREKITDSTSSLQSSSSRKDNTNSSSSLAQRQEGVGCEFTEDFRPPLPAKAINRDEHQNHKLTVKGASRNTTTHSDSLVNLHDAGKVKVATRSLNQPSSREVNVIAAKPPRQAPVRIPTVFAKGDPRAMRYKMAADAVRRRSLQKTEEVSTLAGCGAQASHETPVPKAMEARVSADGMSFSSLRQPLSPPIRTRTTGEPYIPISTNIVRGALATSSNPKVMKSPQVQRHTPTPFKEHSPNVKHPSAYTHTPKIKSAMLPIDNIKMVTRSSSASCKSPKSHQTSAHRYVPYMKETPQKLIRPKPSAL